MPRPGTDVVLLDTPGTISIPTDSGTWFAAGLTERGPTVPALVLSLNQFIQKFGNRMSYSVLYDCVEEFFREGGNRVYIGRVVGPAATSGSVNLLDAGAAISLVAKANGPGAWSTSFTITVYAATNGFGIQVLDTTATVVEDSGPLVDQNAAVAWSAYSNYLTITKGASTNNPATVTGATMSAGNDDRNNITDTQWNTAIAAFGESLGPGQISAPGQTSVTRHSQLVSAAYTLNRVALLDLVDSATSGTLIANLPPYSTSTRFSAAFAPWVTIPGVVAGSTRSVPPSALIAGLIASNDPALGVDAASAGNQGVSNYAIDLSQPDWDDLTRQSLNAAGVNVVRRMFGSIRNYGWRSLANPTTDPGWLDVGNARLFNQLSAEFNAIGEGYVFRNLTQDTIDEFHADLVSNLLDHWSVGDLYGSTPESAFTVDTGPSVNTPQTLANLELHAVCQVKMTPFAEYVMIQVVKRQIADNLSPVAA
jgi:hypothetical protein